MKIHWLHYAFVIALFFIYPPAAIALLILGMMCRWFQKIATRAMLGISQRTPSSWTTKITPVHLLVTGVAIIVAAGVYIMCF